jgi:hypothetical protein
MRTETRQNKFQATSSPRRLGELGSDIVKKINTKNGTPTTKMEVIIIVHLKTITVEYLKERFALPDGIIKK